MVRIGRIDCIHNYDINALDLVVARYMGIGSNILTHADCIGLA